MCAEIQVPQKFQESRDWSVSFHFFPHYFFIIFFIKLNSRYKCKKQTYFFTPNSSNIE